MDFASDSEYESLPTNDVITHMMAGSMAGIGEHCVMYPFDCVKTRMQSIQPNPQAAYRTIPEALYKIVRYEGVFRPMRGMTAVMAGAGPAHAMYYSCYEQMKHFLSFYLNGHNQVAYGISGCVATLLHDAVMNPVEVIKQRMQVYNSPFRTCRECFRTVLQTEGLKAFYRSYTTQLTMNVPYQTLHFMMYEFMQEMTNSERYYDPKAHMVSGAAAGAFAAAITTPLDVCKTLLNTQENQTLKRTQQRRITGLVNALQIIYRIRGVRGYFRGLQARVLFQMPSTAIAWSVYEFFKYTLKLKQLEGEDAEDNSDRHNSNNNNNNNGYSPSVSAKTLKMSDFHATTKAAVTVAAASSVDERSSKHF